MSGHSFWLIIPLIAAVFYVLGNVFQNYCVDTAMPKKQAGAYVATHSISFVVGILLMLGFFGRAAFMLPFMNAFGLVLAGIVNVIGAVFFNKAFQEGDTMDVNIYSEVGPMISLGLSVAILGQSISPSQALAFLFIMGGALLIVFGDDGGKKSKKKTPDFKTVSLTVTACFFSVLSDVIFCYFLHGTKDFHLFAQSFLYFEAGSLLAVILGLILFDSWRKALKKAFVTSKKRNKAIGAMLMNNLTFFTAEIIYKFGIIIAPMLALLSVMNNAAKLIASLVFALVLGKHLPKLAQAKKITKKMLYNYLMAGILILVGVLLING